MYSHPGVEILVIRRFQKITTQMFFLSTFHILSTHDDCIYAHIYIYSHTRAQTSWFAHKRNSVKAEDYLFRKKPKQKRWPCADELSIIHRGLSSMNWESPSQPTGCWTLLRWTLIFGLWNVPWPCCLRWELSHLGCGEGRRRIPCESFWRFESHLACCLFYWFNGKIYAWTSLSHLLQKTQGFQHIFPPTNTLSVGFM